MIKEIKVMKEYTERQKFCDCCNEVITYNLRKCVICNKDLCPKCVEHEENDGGDYYDYYCKNCWTIGEHYRERIEHLEDKIEELSKEWHSKCKP
jgi:hypothetical protein